MSLRGQQYAKRQSHTPKLAETDRECAMGLALGRKRDFNAALRSTLMSCPIDFGLERSLLVSLRTTFPPSTLVNVLQRSLLIAKIFLRGR
jgi:hypothetical protein